MKRMCPLYLAFLWGLTSLALTGGGHAAAFPQASQGGVAFSVDGAAFRAVAESIRQEIYYSLPVASLTYHAIEGGRYRAAYTTEIILRDSLGQTRGTNSWKSENVVSSVAEAKERQLVITNQVEFQLSPGSWQLVLSIRDSVSGRSGEVRLPLRLSSFPPRPMTLSDLEFSPEVRPDTGASIFTKNSYRVTPRPDHRFGGKDSFLYWYCEIYNLSLPAPGSKGTFRLEYTVLDSSGKAVQEVSGEVREKPGTSVVEASGIPLAGLSPGKYELRLKVIDLDAKSEAVREGSFEKAPTKVAAEGIVGGAGSFPVAGFEAYYDQIQYVTTPDTVKILKGLTPEGKKKFLEEFWGRHNLNVFVASMKYVDEQFSSGFKKGHQTDRGRIFLKYGKPDEIVPHPAEEQYPSHEIWFYYSHGGKQFVFSDLTGYGRYELVYSNVPGESSNPKWQTLFDGTELNR